MKHIAVDEIDDKAKEVIIKAGGRVESVVTDAELAENAVDFEHFKAIARNAMSTTLVRLPEKVEVSEGRYRGDIDLTFMLPGTQREVTLTYGISLCDLKATLTYSGEQDYGADEEAQG